jgi:integrase
MPKPRPIPAYRRHSRKDQAVVDVYRKDGKRTKVYLPGSFGSDESKAAYTELLSRLSAHGGFLPDTPGKAMPEDLRIDELILRFLTEKVSVDYVDADGAPTTEQLCYRSALKPLSRLFGWAIAKNFDAVGLSSVRESMVTGSWMNDEEKNRLTKRKSPIGWARGNTNKCVSRIRACFRWAVLQKLVPASVVTDLSCLPSLAFGRGGVRETPPVEPVAVEVVKATLPHLPPVVADMVQVQLLAGCRPGELCGMRMVDLDRSGPIWIFKPNRHKGLHRGLSRHIHLGPQSQVILNKYLKANPDAYLFSPAEQDAAIKTAKRKNRKTSVQPSQVDRSSASAKRKPGLRFSVTAYNRAVGRACRAAGVTHWNVHRLRHTAALLVSRSHGAEAARSVLGHKTLNMTLHYSGIDSEKAIEVMRKMG